jgi:hypothetical protein
MTAPIADPSAAFLQTLDALAKEPRANLALLDWLDHLPQMAMERSLPSSLADGLCTPTDQVLGYANEVLNQAAKARPYLSALPYLRGTGKRSRIRVGLILALPREMLPWAPEGGAVRLQPDGKIEPYENVSPASETIRPKSPKPPGKAARRGSLEDRTVVDTIAPRRLELLVSSTRSSYPGIELNRLSPKSTSGSLLSFPDWMALHEIGILHENEAAAHELLECAYTLACLGRALPPGSAQEKSALLKPLPLLHNQVVGNRLVVRKDRVHSGTPARLHIFLYDTRLPELILNESPRRPTALEYRPDELMAARADRSVRFYLRDLDPDPLIPPPLQALDPATRAKIDEAYHGAQAAYQALKHA